MLLSQFGSRLRDDSDFPLLLPRAFVGSDVNTANAPVIEEAIWEGGRVGGVGGGGGFARIQASNSRSL